MSNIYHTEPPTQGKVVLTTSLGEIDIELWSKEAPLACRNFIQLCLEGYYDNCLVHRVIKEFMIQTGDPTGTGQGGESIWGKPFKDEIHGRLKFNHRGIVAMANENKPHSNHSQFFITLGSCEWLNKKHTIFGKVTGNTIFNLLRFDEIETLEGDVPIEEHHILRTEVLWNPFDDILPRAITRKASNHVEESPSNEPPAHPKKITKKLTLLSFSEEETEPEGDLRLGRAEISVPKKSIKLKEKEDSKDLETRHSPPPLPPAPSAFSTPQQPIQWEGDLEKTEINQEIDNNRTEFNKLRRDFLKARGIGQPAPPLAQVQSIKESSLEHRKAKYLKRKLEGGNRQNETLEKLQQFTHLLRESKQSCPPPERAGGETGGESYHGQVLQRDSDSEEEGQLRGWHWGKLKFKKHIDDQYRQSLGKGEGKKLN